MAINGKRPLSGVEGDISDGFWLRLRSAGIVLGTLTINVSYKNDSMGVELILFAWLDRVKSVVDCDR